MALKKTGADQALDIVKDVDKFKSRLEELAKAEASLTEANDRHREKNNAMNATLDKRIADVNQEVRLAKERVKSTIADGVNALNAAKEMVGDVEKREAILEKKAAKLAEDRANLEARLTQVAKTQSEFSKTVNRFRNAAQAACNGL